MCTRAAACMPPSWCTATPLRPGCTHVLSSHLHCADGAGGALHHRPAKRDHGQYKSVNDQAGRRSRHAEAYYSLQPPFSSASRPFSTSPSKHHIPLKAPAPRHSSTSPCCIAPALRHVRILGGLALAEHVHVVVGHALLRHAWGGQHDACNIHMMLNAARLATATHCLLLSCWGAWPRLMTWQMLPIPCHPQPSRHATLSPPPSPHLCDQHLLRSIDDEIATLPNRGRA